MKKIKALIVSFFLVTLAYSQQSYYQSINFEGLSGNSLGTALQQLIQNASSTYTYGDVRDDFLLMELDPTNSNHVLLTYGWVNNLSCSSGVTDRRIRDKNNFGGSVCDYNREHVFARSNASPTMGGTNNGATGIVADPHNLRATDVQQNSNRGSKKFAAGTGNSGNDGNGNWYPGDEWRGDVARIMMYMYLRYGNRCLPELNAVGAKQGSTQMLQILLQWNIDDPVSQIEDARNNHLETSYGNRNPFIDNPYLATLIWGGANAEDRWGTLSVNTINVNKNLLVYPNPTSINLYLKSTNSYTHYIIYSSIGKEMVKGKLNQNTINVKSLPKGMYVLKLINTQELIKSIQFIK